MMNMAHVFLLLLAPTARAGFRDATTAAGLSGLGSGAAAFGDYDSDGDPDLWVSGQLWRNDGGTFTLMDTDPVMTGSGLFGDFDNDGDVDLYSWSSTPRLHLQDATDAAGWTYDRAGFDTTSIMDSRGAALGDFDGDGLLDVYIGAYETPTYWPDELFLNEGDGSLALAWEEPPSGPYERYVKPGRGVTACDFDQDHDLDVYVSNYRLEINYLWVNDGAAGFTESAGIFGVEGTDDGWSYSYGHTIGSAWGDLDSDGDFDLFVGNFSHPYVWQDRPMFLRNAGEAGGWTFEDVSGSAGLAWQESYASPALGDYDNDGDLDLYFTTVYSGDYPVLYANDGDWTFTDVTSAEGLAGIGATYQAAWADIELDGDLDLVTNGTLYLNDGGDNHWLLVRLRGNGVTSNVSAIGAQARVQIGELTVTRQVEAGTGEHNANDLTLHFGLGDWSEPVEVQVTWPDGSEDSFGEIGVDQQVLLTQCIDADGDGEDDADCGGTDCDDEDPGVYAAAEEGVGDELDQDCDGTELCYADTDVDGARAEEILSSEDEDCADAGEALATAEIDCDDLDPAVLPGAEELCDGLDGDCDGALPEEEADLDADGLAACDGDCDDEDASVYMGAEDLPGDGVDQDCDGADAELVDTGGAETGGGEMGGGETGGVETGGGETGGGETGGGETGSAETGGGETGGDETGGGETGGGETGGGETGGAESGAGESASPVDSAAAEPEVRKEGGCGCATPGAGGAGLWLSTLALTLAAGLRSRGGGPSTSGRRRARVRPRVRA